MRSASAVRMVSAASTGAHSSAPVAATSPRGPADVVGVVVGDDDARDARRVEAVGAHVVEDLVRPRPEAGVDHHQLVARVDDVRVAVQAVREVEAVVAAADQVDVLRQAHRQLAGTL